MFVILMDNLFVSNILCPMESDNLCKMMTRAHFDCLVDRKDFRYYKNKSDHIDAGLFDTNSMEETKLNQARHYYHITSRNSFPFSTHMLSSTHCMISILLNSISRNGPNTWMIYSCNVQTNWINIHMRNARRKWWTYEWKKESIKHKTIMVIFAIWGLNQKRKGKADCLDCHFHVHKIKNNINKLHHGASMFPFR